MPNNFNQDDTELIKSSFNPAVQKMGRLHQVNSLINFAKLNPMAFNSDYSEYNYRLLLRSINILYAEIESKVTPDEKEEIEDIKDAIEQCLDKYPIFQKKVNLDKVETKISMPRWNIFKKHLEIYEMMVRKCADTHGLDTPIEDDSSLF